MKLRVRTLVSLASLPLSVGLFSSAALASEPGQGPAPSGPGAPGQPPPQAPQEPAEGQQSVPEVHGLLQVVAEALAKVDVRPDQRAAIDKLGEEVMRAHAPVDKARTELMLALADHFDARCPGREPVVEKAKALVAVRRQEVPTLRRGFVSLHEILDAEQRAQFVSALEQGIQEKRELMTSDKWREQWSRDLALTPEQAQKIRAITDKFESDGASEREKAAAMVRAFGEDRFDPEAIEPERAVSERVEQRVRRTLDMVKAIGSVLTPDQRHKAAQIIREKATGPKGEQQPPGGEPTTEQPARPMGPSGSSEDVGQAGDAIIVGGGFGGFGRGFGYGTGVVSGYSTGYGFGYPYYGGYGYSF